MQRVRVRSRALQSAYDCVEYHLRLNLLTESQAKALIGLAEEFEERRSEIELKYKGFAVALAGGQLFIGRTMQDAVAQVGKELYHAEFPVGFIG